jgi:hypothetical protein
MNKVAKALPEFFKRSWIDIVVFVVMFLAIVPLPTRVPVDDWDSGSQASYDYWTANHMQYGVDFAQNVGPCAFIDYPDFYSGFFFNEKLAVAMFLTAVLVALAILVSKHLTLAPAKWLFYLTIVVFSTSYATKISPSFVTADVQLFILALLIACGLYILENRLAIGALICTLSLISLSKGTCLFLAPPIVAFATIHHAIHRRTLTAAMVPVVYCASLALFWMLVGQQLSNIPSFFEATFQFARAYNEAMINNYKSELANLIGDSTQICVLLALAASVIPSLKSLSKPDLISRLALTAVQLLVLFVIWKHGFTRTELTHNLIYYQFITIAAVPLLFFPAEAGATPTNFLKKPLVPILTALLLTWTCIMQNCMTDPSLGATQRLSLQTFSRIKDNAIMFFDLANQHKRLDEKLKHSIGEMQLPRVNAVTGKEPVTYWGLDAAPMVYNSFFYRPIPATISFAACNQWIMEKDNAFFRDDAKAPKYLLFTAKTDKHFLPQDDALAQLEIFQRYDPVLLEKERLLLERRKAPSITFEKIGKEETYPLDKWIDAPVNTVDPLRVVIHLKTSAFASLAAAAFRSSIYAIEYKLPDGSVHEAQFVPSTGQAGFLIAPLILNNEDLLAVYSHDGYEAYRANKSKLLSRVSAFRIICLRSIFAAKEMRVSFETVHGLEFGRLTKEIK